MYKRCNGEKKGDKDDEGRRVKEGTKTDYLLPKVIFHTGTGR